MVALFSNPPVSKPLRQSGCASGDAGAYVRKRKGKKWQARLWLGNARGGHINLGHYEAASAARQVVRWVLAEMPADRPWCVLEVWLATQRLVAKGRDIEGRMAGLLPKWVEVTRRGFRGKLLTVEGVVLVGPFPTAEAAHRAVRASFAVVASVPSRCIQPTLCELN